MQFNSLTFIVFFVLVTAFYYALPGWTARKVLLVLASFAFYAAWNPLYVLLLWFSTLADWLLARRIHATATQVARRLWLLCSLAINLGLLGYFKYGHFLLDAFIDVAGRMGIVYAAPDLDIVLPVGISFYTFQTLSYTLDVYRGVLLPRYSLLDFSLFVGFFPQLVAGPIVRASYFLPQCEQPRRFSVDALGWGATLFLFGLFAKVTLADSILAPVADAVFRNPASVATVDAWFGVFAFSGQIFLDFSGYSLCAIGAALCLGFALPDNFRAPFAAVGFSDFWRRWHISLSTWLRDYLYVSLGGSRSGSLKVSFNLAITMLLGGLWHGASWMFVIWGALHAGYLVIEHTARRVLGASFQLRSRVLEIGLGLLTFFVVSVTWVFFRAPNFEVARALLRTLFVESGSGTVVVAERVPLLLLTLGALVTWHWVTRTTPLETHFARWPIWVRAAVIAIAALSIFYSSGGEQHAFIYFQF
jgi:alginate O-acetyltransferase complex protein AlgI